MGVLTTPAGAVPKIWPRSTVVCVGTGPSLLREDVEACRGRAKVLAVKDAMLLAPWADAGYFCGADKGSWWSRNRAAIQAFAGPKFTLDPQAAALAVVLKHTGELGLETSPTGLRSGRNSGYQAVNLAVHLGAAKIVLLGYDFQPGPAGDHYFGRHPWAKKALPYEDFRRCFPTILEPLRALGIAVLNATRSTALEGVPRVSLDEALR